MQLINGGFFFEVRVVDLSKYISNKKEGGGQFYNEGGVYCCIVINLYMKSER